LSPFCHQFVTKFPAVSKHRLSRQFFTSLGNEEKGEGGKRKGKKKERKKKGKGEDR
jgi:hypothetical protein